MKKIIRNINILTILIAILSVSSIVESKDSNVKLPNIGIDKKKKSSKTIVFTPDVAFGGNTARGKYKPKQQSATIIDGDTIYSFTQVTSRPTNPFLHDKKNQPDDIVVIGLFSNSTNRAAMPVITYLFASHANITTTEKQPNGTRKPTPKLPRRSDNNHARSSIQFQPAQQFAGEKLIGNYISSTQTATIQDATGTARYSFENVQQGGMAAPAGLTLIGSYLSSPKCDGGMCAMVMMSMNLYGKLSAEQDISTTPDMDQTSESSDDQQPERKPMGRDQSTWAPRRFDPSPKFSGSGLAGNYFASNKVATIHDPSQNNPVSYTFNNVEQQDEAKCPDGLELIGSYLDNPPCDGDICTAVMRSVNLCGKQVENEDV